MHHDPMRYPDPYAFNVRKSLERLTSVKFDLPPHTQPDRYLGDDLSSAESANLADPMDRDHWTFGVGCVASSKPRECLFFLPHCPTSRSRRICPGIVLAEKEVFLGISCMLWAFKIDPVPGDPIDLKEYDGVSGRSPVPFRVLLTPRDTFVQKVLGV